MDSNLGDNLQDWSLDGDIIQPLNQLNLGYVTAGIDDDELTSLDIGLTSQRLCDNLTESGDLALVENGYREDSGTSLNNLIDDAINDEELSLADSIEVNPFDGLPYSSLYYELLERRKSLPVWRAKDDFVMAVEESPIVLVTGRAGSGKSTQVPQWCVQFAKETDFKMGTVVCAQPCPLTAMSLAIQVAREMDFTEVGNEVGYRVPHTDCTSPNTVLRFTTDELLLREMVDDPVLKDYNFLIIDEAQERTVDIDILLALFKSLQSIRDDLKIIIISQEMDKLEEFFEEVPVLDLYFLEETQIVLSEINSENISEENREELERNRRKIIEEERIKDVALIYDPVEEVALIKSVVNLVVDLHCDQSIAGDFIVFLPSSQEIDTTCEEINKNVAIKALRGLAGEIQVISLHQDLQLGDQQTVYENLLANEEDSQLQARRVIVTNEIAESSFSVGGMSVVVDCGVRIEQVFNTRTRTNFFLRKRISRRSANLRAARCILTGRVYRLYSELEFQNMDDLSVPSVKRIELTSHVLLLKRLLQRLNMDFSECLFLDAPDPEAYMLALEELDYHGALGERGNLSDLGAVMSELPLSVPQAKSVISSCGEDCVQEVLTIVVMLNCPNIWLVPRDSGERLAEVKRMMAHKGGDHFTLLNIFQQFMKYKQSESWCSKHFLKFNSLKVALKSRQELMGILEKLDLPISSPIQDPRVTEISVKRALLAGFFMQIARDTDGCGNYLILRDRHVARIHPNSHVQRSSEWIVYDQFLLTENSYVTVVSNVTPRWIAEVVPQSYLMNLPQHETKNFLLEVSSRWRKKLAEQEGTEDREAPEQCGAIPSQQAIKRRSEKRHSLSERDPGDIDLITQTARGVVYAYHQAAEYMSKPEREEAQCTLQ